MRSSRPLDRLPEPVRRVITEEVRVVNQRLRSVRRPRDLRRLIKDPQFVTDLSEPLAPALDKMLTMVVKGAAPLSPRLATAGAAAIAGASATAESIMEITALLGIEAPPVAVAIGSSAAGIGVGAQLAEFYITASVVWGELRRAGREDVTLLRRVLIATYVGDDRTGSGVGLNRVAAALIRRAIPSFVPVAGIPMSVRSAVKSQRQAVALVAEYLEGRAD